MAKILCASSGIEFTCEHFPAFLTSRECSHPIFSLSQKKLLSYYPKWEAAQLTPTDSYLLFLALLNSTELVQFRVPAHRTTTTDAIVANNMEDLVQIVSKMSIIKATILALPQFVISPETKTLDTAHYWIAAWESCYEEFQSGYTANRRKEKIYEREAYLEKLIKDGKEETHYAASLAEWASLAGGFPDSNQIPTPFGPMTLAEYWKLIIRKCARAESIFQITAVDLEDLIEHCEDNIDAGSIYAHALFKLLRDGRAKQQNFLGLGDLGNYKILQENDSVEDANKLVLIQTAPTEMPSPLNYPNRLAYLKDKAKWDMAQQHKAMEIL
jgi:hypothetical protein